MQSLQSMGLSFKARVRAHILVSQANVGLVMYQASHNTGLSSHQTKRYRVDYPGIYSACIYIPDYLFWNLRAWRMSLKAKQAFIMNVTADYKVSPLHLTLHISPK